MRFDPLFLRRSKKVEMQDTARVSGTDLLARTQETMVGSGVTEYSRGTSYKIDMRASRVSRQDCNMRSLHTIHSRPCRQLHPFLVSLHMTEPCPAQPQFPHSTAGSLSLCAAPRHGRPAALPYRGASSPAAAWWSGCWGNW